MVEWSGFDQYFMASTATLRPNVLDPEGPALRLAFRARGGSVRRLLGLLGLWSVCADEVSRAVRSEAARHATHARSVGADAREVYWLHAGYLLRCES